MDADRLHQQGFKARPSHGPPRLDEILSAHPSPYLGEIVRASNADWTSLVKAHRDRNLLASQASEMWKAYDLAYADRWDYRLWRRCFRKGTHIEESPFQLAHAGLQADDEIAWGTLAVLSGLLVQSDQSRFSTEERETLVAEVQSRFSRSFPPLPGAHAGCGFVKLLMLGALQRAQFQLYNGADIPLIERHFDRIAHCLTNEITQGTGYRWWPGAVVSNAGLRNEGREGRVILPFRSFEASIRAANVLFSARAAVRENFLDRPDHDTLALLQRALGFGVSAWRTMRSVRIGEERISSTRSDWRPRLNMRWLVEAEMRALWRASQAALDANRHHLAAGLACILLRTLPDELVDTPEFKDLGSKLGASIREAGLEVDPRFAGKKSSYTRKDPDQFRSPHKIRQREKRTPREVLKDASSPVDRENALQFALERANLRTAAVALTGISGSSRCVIAFAQSFARVSRLLPIAANFDSLRDWQVILREAWISCDPSDFSTEQVAVVHQALMGRHIGNIRSLGDSARMLIRRAHGQLSDDTVRTVLNDGPYSPRTSVCDENTASVAKSVSQISRHLRRRMIAVSAVHMTDGCWSLIAIDPFGRSISRLAYVPGFAPQTAANLKVTATSWLSPGGVPWGRSGRAFASAILSIASDLGARPEGILLCIEPEFAGLPWQDVIGRIEGWKTLVSIVPSLAWLSTSYNERTARSPNAFFFVGASPDLQELGNAVMKDLAAAGHAINAAVIVEHGVAVQNPLSPFASRPHGGIDWLRIADHRICIAHSCYSGSTHGDFLGDMGGIPGCLLSLACRLYCAPVSAIPIATATHLHRFLVADEARDQPFGNTYLSAAEEDPTVALYNLYGFPDERFQNSLGRSHEGDIQQATMDHH